MAVFSVFAVITGSWLVFRAQSPSKNEVLISDHDRKAMIGQTGQSNIARAPSRERVEKS